MSEAFKEFEKDAWEAKAGRYSDTWGTVTAQVNDTILAQIENPAGKKLLDLGCGPGHLSKKASLLGMQPLGADYSETMAAIAKKNYPDLDFVTQDAEALTLKEKSFDVVIMNYLLLHVADQGRVLLEAKRVLKPGGTLLYTNWLSPADSPGLKIIFEALKEYADMTVIPPAQDIFMFSDFMFAKEFAGHNGFTDMSSLIFDSVWKFTDGSHFFQAIQAGTRMGGLVDLQTQDIKDKIKAKISKDIEKFKSAEGYIIPTPSIIVSFKLD